MKIKKIAIEDKIKHRKKKIIELTSQISQLMKANQKDEEELKKI